ncbi:hypothetical protein BpHYR1_041886 [Brachionus plicatilis]|uniref:Uncharacterized protein n=1 Tax=Brachionus plicatilis TaxID=10195 RepID=A0A3M7S172_BRAPC|nr:hypothetical protein BpHYR1_041886 [Brachionus plicatilis]
MLKERLFLTSIYYMIFILNLIKITQTFECSVISEVFREHNGFLDSISKQHANHFLVDKKIKLIQKNLLEKLIQMLFERGPIGSSLYTEIFSPPV